MMPRLLAPSLVIFLPGCAWTWDKVDFCDTGGCEECEGDDDCVVGSSCCGEIFFCMHRDEQLNVCQLGCFEPDPPPCACVVGRCRF